MSGPARSSIRREGECVPESSLAHAGAPIGEDPMLRIDSAWRLDLALSLQTTLDIGCTVELFARHSATIVPHDAVVFAAPQAALSVTKGRPGACGHSVELVLDKRPLGCLTFSRRGPFEPGEILALEAMAADLTRPLDNALRYREVREAAIRDPLTGAANRRHLERSLEREVSLVRRHGEDLALLMVDIDRFKSVNDRFGHLTGDRCLAAIAKCITACVRDSDTLFRYGGEEFCVLLAHTGAGGAWRLAERVREAVGTLRIPAGAQTIRLTASLGVASLAPGEGAEDLLRKADAALYRSKRSGRDTVCTPTTAPEPAAAPSTIPR